MINILELVARVCHEANRSYCESIGDHSQPAWADAPDWQKKSVMAGVENVFDNPDSSPEQSHDMWMKMKLDDGWKWGPEKDPERKEHPCIMPYSELPDKQRAKDDLFLDVARIMLHTII